MRRTTRLRARLHRMRLYRSAATNRSPTRAERVLALNPYPAPEQLERELESLAATGIRAGWGIDIVDYGRSVEGRSLQAVRIRRRERGPGPRVLICANTHGPEFIGNRVCVGVLDSLAHRKAPLPLDALLERAELWLAPCLNPDG